MLIAVRDFPSGKTVSYKIIDKVGAIVQDWTVTGVTERVIDATTETAIYQVDSGAITTGFEGHAFWKTSDAIPLIASETFNIQSVNLTSEASTPLAKEATLANGTYGLSALNTDIDTLLARVVGTLATGTHNPQSGDAYPIVNNGTYGNNALNTDLDTLLARATELRLAELDPANIPTDIANVKGDTAAILDDTGTTGVVVASGSKAGYSLAADQSGVTVGTVNALGTQAKADVNAEVDLALNTAIPGSPTADSINERVKAVDDALTVTVYSVVADANNSTLQFKTNLPNADTNNAYQNGWVRFTSGALAGLPPRRVFTYNATTKILVFTSSFPVAPATNDTFIMMVGSVAD